MLQTYTINGILPRIYRLKKSSPPVRMGNLNIGGLIILDLQLQLGTSSNESLAGIVGSVLSEVLDEASSQVLSLLLPLSSSSVSVARIKDSRIYVGQSGGNLEVEQRKLLGLSLQDAAIENSVNDTTCIGN